MSALAVVSSLAAGGAVLLRQLCLRDDCYSFWFSARFCFSNWSSSVPYKRMILCLAVTADSYIHYQYPPTEFSLLLDVSIH